MNREPPAHEPPPAARMMQMLTAGRQIAHCLGTVARLDVATHLGDGALGADELARRTNSHAGALYRVMRALASVGVFTEVEPRTFRNTPLSETLRADVPGSSRPLSLFFCHDVHIQTYLGLDHSVRTGESGFQHVHGAPPFEYVMKHPEVAAVFNDAMTAFSAAFGPAIAHGYPFDGIARLIDVGGGHGALLAAILALHPEMKGVLFDLPPVVDGASRVLEPLGVASRVEVIGGDFFHSVPEGDAYLMSHVLHDWSDPDARRILETIHRAARPNARLLLAESIIEPGNAPDITKFMDVEMLVTGGAAHERTAAEWTDLLRSGGFRLERVIPTPAPVTVIEATRV